MKQIMTVVLSTLALSLAGCGGGGGGGGGASNPGAGFYMVPTMGYYAVSLSNGETFFIKDVASPGASSPKPYGVYYGDVKTDFTGHFASDTGTALSYSLNSTPTTKSLGTLAGSYDKNIGYLAPQWTPIVGVTSSFSSLDLVDLPHDSTAVLDGGWTGGKFASHPYTGTDALDVTINGANGEVVTSSIIPGGTCTLKGKLTQSGINGVFKAKLVYQDADCGASQGVELKGVAFSYESGVNRILIATVKSDDNEVAVVFRTGR